MLLFLLLLTCCLGICLTSSYPGYGNGTGNQDEQSNYVNSNNLHVIPMVGFDKFHCIYLLLYLVVPDRY